MRWSPSAMIGAALVLGCGPETPMEPPDGTVVVEERLYRVFAQDTVLYQSVRLDGPDAHTRLRELLEAQARDAWAQGWSEIRCQVRLAHRRVVSSVCRGDFSVPGAVRRGLSVVHLAIEGDDVHAFVLEEALSPASLAQIREDSASACRATSSSEPASLLASRCERAMASPHHAVLEPDGVRSFLFLEDDGSSGVDGIEVLTPLRDLQPADIADGALARVLGRARARSTPTTNAWTIDEGETNSLVATWATLEGAPGVALLPVGGPFGRLIALSEEDARAAAEALGTTARPAQVTDQARLLSLRWARTTRRALLSTDGASRAAIVPEGSLLVVAGPPGLERRDASLFAWTPRRRGRVVAASLEAHDSCRPRPPSRAPAPLTVLVEQRGEAIRRSVIFVWEQEGRTRLSVHDLNDECAVGAERAVTSIDRGGLFFADLVPARADGGPTLLVVGTTSDDGRAHLAVLELGHSEPRLRRDLDAPFAPSQLVTSVEQDAMWLPVAYEQSGGRWLGLEWVDGTLREVEIRRP